MVNNYDLSVYLTYKKFLRTPRTIICKTNYRGRSNKNSNIPNLLFYYDDLGNRLDDEISQQIWNYQMINNNFLLDVLKKL